MTIWVPWTDIAPETEAFCWEVGALPAKLSDPDEDYGRFMAERWDRGAGFIIVEQDVVPTPEQIDGLRVCGHPLCSFGYEGEDTQNLMFGCVRFSADFIAAYPNLWTDYLAARDVPEGHRDHDFSAARCRRWMMLPEWVDHANRDRRPFPRSGSAPGADGREPLGVFSGSRGRVRIIGRRGCSAR